jgi:HD-GYP domain-containing protein (c-di-GMP phosphodiesterase class II)
VAAYALAIATALGCDGDVRRVLQRGGVLHDIGKIGIPDAILKKAGPLSAAETALMQRHPAIGCDLLRDMPFLDGELAVIRHHHERWDGGGYPDRLVGEAIPLAARILAVADAFDAMTSDRPYRRGMPLMVARTRLLDGAGSQFWRPAAYQLVSLIDAGTVRLIKDEPALSLVETAIA